jgi:hypothetical protein
MVRKIDPPATDGSSLQIDKSSSSDIQSFLKTASTLSTNNQGRLIFALDATMSRQPTWDRATSIQSSMFETAGSKSGLAVQLVYFRGNSECRASKWVYNTETLAKLMTKIDCRGGTTQISKVLNHTTSENSKKHVSALVFIGDAVEESIDPLCAIAGKLGVHATRAFMFQEGNDANTEKAFREIARLSGGAYMKFSENSAKELEELLGAVATYATGGLSALKNLSGSTARQLIEQINK